MESKTIAENTYSCRICGLHYESRKMAEKCYNWCSLHNACSMEITAHSVERTRAPVSKQ